MLCAHQHHSVGGENYTNEIAPEVGGHFIGGAGIAGARVGGAVVVEVLGRGVGVASLGGAWDVGAAV